MRTQHRYCFLSICFLLACGTVDLSVAQGTEGFFNIDCGRPKGYTAEDENTGLTYTSDEEYISAGKTGEISKEYQTLYTHSHNLRSFPNGTRNCYSIHPVNRDELYLVRAYFIYGNYDGLNEIPSFDVHLDVNPWVTIQLEESGSYIYREILAIAQADTMSICLLNVDKGIPFVNAIDVRPMEKTMYTQANSTQSLVIIRRANFGEDTDGIVRYKSDPYDRFWHSVTSEDWENITTNSTIVVTTMDRLPPEKVMATGVAPLNNVSMDYTINTKFETSSKYMLQFYFAELENSDDDHPRVIDIKVNNQPWKTDITGFQFYRYLSATGVHSEPPMSYDKLEISLSKANNSELPPLINALEVYEVKSLSEKTTHYEDVVAIMDVKVNFEIKKNWMGDPCAPEKFVWDGLSCTGHTENHRITSLNLTSNGLKGKIPTSLANLTELQHFDNPIKP